MKHRGWRPYPPTHVSDAFGYFQAADVVFAVSIQYPKGRNDRNGRVSSTPRDESANLKASHWITIEPYPQKRCTPHLRTTPYFPRKKDIKQDNPVHSLFLVLAS